MNETRPNLRLAKGTKPVRCKKELNECRIGHSVPLGIQLHLIWKLANMPTPGRFFCVSSRQPLSELPLVDGTEPPVRGWHSKRIGRTAMGVFKKNKLSRYHHDGTAVTACDGAVAVQRVAVR